MRVPENSLRICCTTLEIDLRFYSVTGTGHLFAAISGSCQDQAEADAENPKPKRQQAGVATLASTLVGFPQLEYTVMRAI